MSVTKLNGLRLQRMIVAGANELHANKQQVISAEVLLGHCWQKLVTMLYLPT